MRGSLRLQLFSALVLPPVIVAAVLTAYAIRLFRQDKELYVYDLSAQTVELIARDLSSKLAGLRTAAELGAGLEASVLAVRRAPPEKTGESTTIQIRNLSQSGESRLRVRYPGADHTLELEVRPEALLDLRGGGSIGQLMLMSSEGELLVHADDKRVKERRGYGVLLDKLRLFAPGTPRVGTRAADLEGVPSLVAFAGLPAPTRRWCKPSHARRCSPPPSRSSAARWWPRRWWSV